LLTLKQHIRLNKKQYKILLDYAHYSNNLYNVCVYNAKLHFKETNKYISLKELMNLAQLNENYKLLPSQTSQQIVRLVDKNFRSFFALLRKKKLGQYNDNIKEPNFKIKGGLFNIIFCYQNAYLKKDKIYFCKSKKYKEINPNKLEIDFSYKLDGKIKQIMFQPKNKGQYFIMYINYEENKNKIKKGEINYENYLSIDLGVNNLAACFDNASGHSFILNGKPLKSYNRWYNKTKAKIQSELELKNKRKWSKKLQNLSQKRSNFIDNYFNQYISYLMKYCLNNKIGNIVIGYNKEWKQNLNLGKINNQKFMYISYNVFKQKLENKCKNNGVNFILTEESYSSKCSAIDFEKLGKHENYLGQRIKRGLFKSAKRILINADINGSINILRKIINDNKINITKNTLNTNVISNVI